MYVGVYWIISSPYGFNESIASSEEKEVVDEMDEEDWSIDCSSHYAIEILLVELFLEDEVVGII